MAGLGQARSLSRSERGCSTNYPIMKGTSGMPRGVRNVVPPPPSPEDGNGVDAIGSVTNDADVVIALNRPYTAQIDIEGVAALLCHRWSDDAVAAKASAAKGSAAKKTDDIESYVYRTPDGHVGLSGTQMFGAICGPQGAAKYRQDPRSPRKSALDLFRAGVAVLDDVTPLLRDGRLCSTWDYLDRRRVTVQRAGVTRVRPAFVVGWRATFTIQVALAAYISPQILNEVIVDAGRLCGVGDFRPTFGRFNVVRFEVLGEL